MLPVLIPSDIQQAANVRTSHLPLPLLPSQHKHTSLTTSSRPHTLSINTVNPTTIHPLAYTSALPRRSTTSQQRPVRAAEAMGGLGTGRPVLDGERGWERAVLRGTYGAGQDC